MNTIPCQIDRVFLRVQCLAQLFLANVCFHLDRSLGNMAVVVTAMKMIYKFTPPLAIPDVSYTFAVLSVPRRNLNLDGA